MSSDNQTPVDMNHEILDGDHVGILISWQINPHIWE